MSPGRLSAAVGPLAATVLLCPAPLRAAEPIPLASFDTKGAEDPALIATLTALRDAAAAKDVAALKALLAPDVRTCDSGLAPYDPTFDILKSACQDGDPKSPWTGIYRIEEPHNEQPIRRGQPPVTIEQLQREAWATRDRDLPGALLPIAEAALAEGPIGTVRQMGSKTCAPADPVLPPAIAGEIERIRRRKLKDVNSEPSNDFAMTLRDTVVLAQADPASPQVTVLPARAILHFNGIDGRSSPEIVAHAIADGRWAYPVKLVDGRRGWVLQREDGSEPDNLRSLYQQNFWGLCFGKVNGAWRVTSVVQQTL